MDDSSREQLRKQLQNSKAELHSIAATSQAATGTVVLDQSSVGRLSRMDAMAGQQMALESERRRQQQLRGIEAALARIDSADFGCCEECGEDIPLGRLQINPATRLCVSCSE